jgi:flavin reductase (DIM6/NTAB) family NADH-FMN oxidoreductase RutF
VTSTAIGSRPPTAGATDPTARQGDRTDTDGDVFWNAVRRFPTGVAVVTTGSGEDVHGATVSAFSFISRTPPVVAVCLQGASRLLRRIREHGHLTVNVLGSGQADVARRFASRGRGSGRHQFDGIGWIAGDGGVPRLSGTVCWMHCRPRELIVVGDHELVLADVISLAQGAGTPLLYFAGGLHPGAIQIEESRR